MGMLKNPMRDLTIYRYIYRVPDLRTQRFFYQPPKTALLFNDFGRRVVIEKIPGILSNVPYIDYLLDELPKRQAWRLKHGD